MYHFSHVTFHFISAHYVRPIVRVERSSHCDFVAFKQKINAVQTSNIRRFIGNATDNNEKCEICVRIQRVRTSIAAL